MRKLKILILLLFLFGLGVLIWRISKELQVPSLSQKVVANVNEAPSFFYTGEVKTTNGVKHTIPLEFLVSGGPARSNIKAITEPKFESTQAANSYLREDSNGLAVNYEGVTRFYAFQVLVWHEVVNDDLNNLPVAVTYGPLSGSATVFIRRLGTLEVALGVTDKVYNNSPILHDLMNGNLFSQLTGEVVVGDLAGQRLPIIPSDIITWKSFRDNYRDGQVLSRETGYKNDYSFDPYGEYGLTGSIYYPLIQLDQRFHPKTSLLGIVINKEPKAYIEEKVRREGLINDELAKTALVIWVDSQTKAIRIFERRVEKAVLSFEIKDNRLFDHQTNSTWNFSGEAIAGKLKGSKLSRPEYVSSYWFSWYAFYPSTIVWGL